MSTKLFRMELTRLARDGRVRWIALTLVVLLAITFGAACREAVQSARETRAATARERDRWLSQNQKNPHSAAHYGIWAFKSPTALATLDSGIEPYVGRTVRVEAHRYNDALFRPTQDATPISRSGISTVAQVLTTIVPLACLLMSFGAVAVDRERGTLQLAMGNGATGGSVLMARTFALLTVAGLAAAVPAVALGAISMAVIGDSGGTVWPRLLAFAGANLVHACVFVLIGVVISATARTARTALATSLLAWVALSVVTPRLATAYVEQVEPTPSYQAARMRAEAEIKRYNTAELHQAREETFRSATRSPSGEDSFDVRGAMLHDREQHDYAAFDAQIGAFETSLRKQERLASRLGFLSPTLATQGLSNATAGVDLTHHLHFLTAVERYRRLLSDTMNLDLRAHPTVDGKPYLAGAHVWSKVPAFENRAPAIADALATRHATLWSLALWVVVVASVLALVGRRLKP